MTNTTCTFCTAPLEAGDRVEIRPAETTGFGVAGAGGPLCLECVSAVLNELIAELWRESGDEAVTEVMERVMDQMKGGCGEAPR